MQSKTCPELVDSCILPRSVICFVVGSQPSVCDLPYIVITLITREHPLSKKIRDFQYPFIILYKIKLIILYPVSNVCFFSSIKCYKKECSLLVVTGVRFLKRANILASYTVAR